MSMLNSILFNTDSYKVSMWKQYPEGTEYVYSYIEARSPSNETNEVVFFGLQAFVLDYLMRPITRQEIELADEFWTAHGEPFNREGWEYILKKHRGYLPIRIRAVPEGSVVPVGNVLVSVENTDPKVPWITTWVETPLLRAVWYPSSVASKSYLIRQMLKKALEESGDVSGLDFKLHDFGARGCSSLETASLGGAAHLLSFNGTDTASGILRAVQSYRAIFQNTGFSIPAAEHSTITSWGRENETKAYANMVSQFGKPGSVFAVVSDSYNIYEACRAWSTGALKDQVLASGGTLVVRPDSGDPVVVLPSIISILAEGYGFTLNDKGYKVLNTVRIIWGDGINATSIAKIRDTVMSLGWSMDNIAFGMGGALLGAPQRDDFGWAMKCSAVRINGEWKDVYKDPIDSSSKKSKRGRVTLFKTGSTYYSGVEDWAKDTLDEVFLNGRIMRNESFEEIRARVRGA